MQRLPLDKDTLEKLKVGQGALIQHLRNQARLTQEQLAEKSGVKLSTLRSLEQGEHLGKQETIFCLFEHGLEMDVTGFYAATAAYLRGDAPNCIAAYKQL